MLFHSTQVKALSKAACSQKRRFQVRAQSVTTPPPPPPENPTGNVLTNTTECLIKFVLIRPGWTAFAVTFAPSSFKRLASSAACNTLANLDCPYANLSLYLRKQEMEIKTDISTEWTLHRKCLPKCQCQLTTSCRWFCGTVFLLYMSPCELRMIDSRYGPRLLTSPLCFSSSQEVV